MIQRTERVSQNTYAYDFLPWLLLLTKSLYQSSIAAFKSFPQFNDLKSHLRLMVLWGGKLCWAQLAGSGLSLAWPSHCGICSQLVGWLGTDWLRIASLRNLVVG